MSDKTDFGQKRVLDAHHADVHEVFDVVLVREGAGLLNERRRLDVLVRRKVVHDHRDLCVVENRGRAVLLENVDRDRRGNVVAENHVELGVDQLTSLDFFEPRVSREDFLGHCHTHIVSLQFFNMLIKFFKTLEGSCDVGLSRVTHHLSVDNGGVECVGVGIERDVV